MRVCERASVQFFYCLLLAVESCQRLFVRVPCELLWLTADERLYEKKVEKQEAKNENKEYDELLSHSSNSRSIANGNCCWKTAA